MAALAPAGELALVKGNILSGETETTVVQSYRFDLLAAKHTKAEGWRHQRFKAYDDSPKVGDFDWGGILFSVIGAVAACVVVGALSLTGIGAFVVGGLVAGVVCGALYSGRDAIEAGVSGIDFIKVVLSGAVVGGIQGLINGLVSFGVFSIGALLAGTTIVGMGIEGIMICGEVFGGFSSAIHQLLFCGTVDPNLLAKDIVQSSIFSGLFYGISSIRTFNATGRSGGIYVGIGNQYTGNGFIFGRSNGSVGGLVVKGGQIVPSGIAYIPGKGIVFAKPIQGGGLSPVTTNQVNPYSYLPFTGPQYQLPSSTPLGVGEYNTIITWDSHVLPAR